MIDYYPPNNLPELCLVVPSEFLASQVHYYTDDSQVIFSDDDMTEWVAQEMTGVVTPFYHFEDVGEVHKHCWMAVKFENERDLMVFKMFWL